MHSPIALFTYNRLRETQQTVGALQKNYLASESELFIFSDGAKTEAASTKVDEVRRFLKTIAGFKKITLIESPVNKGLAGSIIDGVTQMFQKFDRVIVLEDDLVTTPNFLTFMNGALNYYDSEEKVQSICGYSPHLKKVTRDIYFQRRPFSWGWATWRSYWNNTVFEKEIMKNEIETDPSLVKGFVTTCGNNVGKMLTGSLKNTNDSWFVRWAFGQYKNGCYSVYPSHSLVDNVGFGVDGTHCKGINPYTTLLMDGKKQNFDFRTFEAPLQSTEKEFLNYFTRKQRVKVRVGLLSSKEGRMLLWDELKSKVL